MKYTLFLFAFLFSTLSIAQPSPVSWSFEAQHLGDKTYLLQITADIEEGWYIYSQYLESDEGPIKTSFVFEDTNIAEMIGITEEQGKRKEGYDNMFAMNVIKFSEKVVFSQKVKVKDKNQTLKGYLTYMTCDDGSCLPPKDIPFEIKLN